MKSAVAGAIRTRSAQLASDRCAISHSAGSCSAAATGWRDSAASVSGVVKCAPLGVSTHRTSTPLLTRARTSAGALNAAMLPVIPSATRRTGLAMVLLGLLVGDGFGLDRGGDLLQVLPVHLAAQHVAQ